MSTEMRNRNLDALEKRFPGISKIIEDKKEELLEQEAIQIAEETAFTGEKILTVKTGGRKLYLAGRRNPMAHPQNQIKILGEIVPNAPVFILGMGNLHYLEELVNQTDESVILLLYEPLFSVFYKQLERADFDKMFGKRTVAIVVGGINDDGLEGLVFSMLRGDKIPLMKYFVLPNYVKLCMEAVKKFYDCLSKYASEYKMGVSTNLFFSPFQAENFYHNVQYVRTGYKASSLMHVLPKDVPAIVIAAGPSLNKNIKELKRAKGKAFLIAVDTAVKRLLKEGILPDMFATLDGMKTAELLNLTEQEEAAKEIPLLTKVTASKSLMDYHKGKKFFINDGYRYINQIYKMNGKALEGFTSGGSVATYAFAFACHLGFRKVIFVGQDLAYTDNKSHADGTFQEEMPEENTEKFLMVPGNYQEEVPTLSNLDSYRKWFGDFIHEWGKKYDVEFINATEGGAKIEGTKVMALAEAINQECKEEVDISACINQLEPEFDKEAQGKILDYFHDTPKKVHEIISLAKEGKKIYAQLDKLCRSGNMDRRAYLKLLKRVKRNRKKIEENVNYDLLQQSMVRAEQILRSGQYFSYDSLEEEGLELARQGKKYMELLEEYTRIIEAYTEQTVAKVE